MFKYFIGERIARCVAEARDVIQIGPREPKRKTSPGARARSLQNDGIAVQGKRFIDISVFQNFIIRDWESYLFFSFFFCFILYHVFRLLLLLVRSRRSREIFFCLRRRFAMNKTAQVSYSGYGTRSMFRKIRYRHDGENENTRVPIKPWSASNRNFGDVPISTHLLSRHICAKRLFKVIAYS